MDTALPNYSSPGLQNKESATYNTDYILNTYSDKKTEAFTYCRSIEPLKFNNKSYQCQLPNGYEIMQIFNNREKLYELDPTASSNTSYSLKTWTFNKSSYLWTSNEGNTVSSWVLGSDGYWNVGIYGYKNWSEGVVPIIEIPLG